VPTRTPFDFPLLQHAKRMLDTRLGASMTLSMPFIIAMLCTSVFFGITTYGIGGVVPELEVHNMIKGMNDDSLYGSILVRTHVAGAFATGASCQNITLAKSASQFKCDIKSSSDKTTPELVNSMLLCSVNIECIVLNKVTGNQDVMLSLPKHFQTMSWTVEPKESWNHLKTQINHTLQPTNDGTESKKAFLLAGTETNPTLLNIGFLRSLIMDSTEDKHLQIKNKNGTFDAGVQLAWAGQNLVETVTGPASNMHYVAFRFSIDPFIYFAQARDLKDKTTQYISILTLFLSIMSALRVAKTQIEPKIDQLITWYTRKQGRSVPSDILRRKRVLEEHAITGKPGSRQRRMSSSADALPGINASIVPDRDLIWNGGRMFVNPVHNKGKQTSVTTDIELTSIWCSDSDEGNQEKVTMRMFKMEMYKQREEMNKQREEMNKQREEMNKQREELSKLKRQIIGSCNGGDTTGKTC
jgi:hypothetical protein